MPANKKANAILTKNQELAIRIIKTYSLDKFNSSGQISDAEAEILADQLKFIMKLDKKGRKYYIQQFIKNGLMVQKFIELKGKYLK